jgi:ATP-dependent DNA ligase
MSSQKAHPLIGTLPMEAKLVDGLPEEPGWQFEPKWDGFRCLAFREGDAIELQSKSGKSLGRFFPEIVAMLGTLPDRRFVLDGELIIPIGDVLSFDALQARLHPAESRIRRLSSETPASYMLFDCLALGAKELVDRPLATRRSRVEHIFDAVHPPQLLLSPYTRDRAVATQWLKQGGSALDGVVAKGVEERYHPGERAMLKVKQRRTADCVVGGFRYQEGSKQVGSLLLGLFDDQDRLNHVGFTSSLPATERASLTRTLEALIEQPGFTGTAPGGPSRWNTGRSAEWQPLRPALVVEILYDQVTGDRFRHGTRLMRWRPDKAPEQCRMDQLQHELRPAELAQLMKE